MLVLPEDLVELDEPSGSRFQDFVVRLVQLEASTIGLNSSDIDIDFRTNVKDGGCDIVVKKGQNQFPNLLIPSMPSIWSIKAGKNGVTPSILANELKPAKKRQRLISHLLAGNMYVWCALQPASQNTREAMQSKANDVSLKLGIDPNLIQFVWIDHLCSALNRFPNLIAEQLPRLHSIIGPMMTLTQWKEESPDKNGLKVPFVDVPGAKELQTRIVGHLLGSDTAAVFHVAGLSGIGKTRTTIETCLSNDNLTSVLYVGAFAKIEQQFWRRLLSTNVHIKLIIDEVPLEEVTHLQDRIDGYGDRIRIISIGPAPRSQSRRQRDPMLVQLEPPDEIDGVLPVVNAAAPDLSKNVRRSIAHFAGHDLRLALLLVDATLLNGQFTTAPLRDFEDVWTRIMWLFSKQIKDSTHFRNVFEILTLAVDIGIDGNHRNELTALANFFGKTEADFDGVVRDANDCGLGERLQFFFEAKPAALAVWLFQERLWPILRPRIQAFIKSSPSSRLLRRFMERCQQTASPYREDIESEIGIFFLILLGNPDLKTISEREPSRIFQTWAEFDPKRGLEWLEQAVSRASDDDLREFTGETDGSGGWLGRRQIVWLCENMACFHEYFLVCERILFRLAQVETEERIGNNSTNTWQEMFLPILANTEVPYPQRLDLLKDRLRAATPKTIHLILGAFFRSIERYASRISSPSIVGGRIVPDQWRPGTIQELEHYRQTTAKSLLDLIAGLSGEVAEYSVKSVVTETPRLLSYGVVREYSKCVKPFLDNESLKRLLLNKLDEWLSWQDREDATESKPSWIGPVRRLRNKLAPATLYERIKDTTSREYWSVYRVSRRQVTAIEDPIDVYSDLAKELLRNLEVLNELTPWLTSVEAVSASNLFNQLGFNDVQHEVLPTVIDWLRQGLHTNLAAQYLFGIRRSTNGLPISAIQTLDEISSAHPANALQVTLLADQTKLGVHRLMPLVGSLDKDRRGMLWQLSYEPWMELFSVPQKTALIDLFCKWAETGDFNAVRIAMHIVGMWLHHHTTTLPPELTSSLLRLVKLTSSLEVPVDDHFWQKIMTHLAPTASQTVAELLADEMTNIKSHRYERRKLAQAALQSMSIKSPTIVMESIGKWILDTQRCVVFRVFGCPGLFDAIGIDTVRPWVEKHGLNAAIGIARSLNGPSIKEGIPHIPELADWLLTTFQDNPKVFTEFAMGRHSGDFQRGHPRDKDAQVDKFLSSFITIKKNWVQQWIKYERDNHRWDVAIHDRMDEEFDRT